MTSLSLARAGVRHAGRAAGAWWRTVRAEAVVEGMILPPVNIVYDDLANLRIGRSSIVHPFSEIAIITQRGRDQRCGLYVGERTSIGTGANLRGSGGVITIGDDCLLGQHVSIIAANHSLARDRPIRDQRWADQPVDVVIEDDVHVGAGAIVLPGSVVGRGAVVAGGALVRGKVEPYTIVAGVPARPVGVRQ